MKTIILAALMAAWAATAVAQQKAADHGAHHAASAASAASAADMTEGEVRKVDREAKKLTIKHGEIRNLDMPPMTMVLAVKDGVPIDKLKAGDKIRFVVEKAASGYQVIDIRIAP